MLKRLLRTPATSAALLTASLLTLGAWQPASAQVSAADIEWKEAGVPPPPTFNVEKLIMFDVPSSLSLVYGVDPATISISKEDSVLRYVVVATSATGARNVMYEGLRCATGEFKTYARASSDGKWNAVSNPEWRTVFGPMPSRHALSFARAGACDSATPVSSAKELVNNLKNSQSSRK